MAVRISTRMMYEDSIHYMNNSLSALMDNVVASSTQKRINKPSDDPAGMAEVMRIRAKESQNAQYLDNLSMATGWISSTDGVYSQIETLLTKFKEKTEQAATASYDADNRLQISFEMREIFEQMITLSNAEFAGKHIFAGHKYNQSAFVETVHAHSNTLADADFVASGTLPRSTVVQFLDTGDVGGVAPLDYRYSSDGGKTWTTATLAAGTTTLNLGTATVEMIPTNGATVIPVTAVDPANLNETNNGSWLYVRPSAQYMGDENYSRGIAPVSYLGGGGAYTLGSVSATGYFDRDISVRIDDSTAYPASLDYSYSVDNGSTWISATTNNITGITAILNVPGGTFTFDGTPADGDQFVIKPHRADLEFALGKDSTMTVNNAGLDIFGGIYQGATDTYNTAVRGGDSSNLFEVLGRIIGYTETNGQTGIAQGLDELTDLLPHITTEHARVGGKANRIQVTKAMLENHEYELATYKSRLEDADLSTLLTENSQKQLAYNTVLKSSSMIMQMSLVNFL